MAETMLRLKAERVAQGLVLHMTGEITGLAEEALLRKRDWEQQLRPGKSTLILDFIHVSSIDRNGMSLLQKFVRAAEDQGVTLSAFGLTFFYEHLFYEAGLTEFMTIFPNQNSFYHRIKEHSAQGEA